MNEKSGVRNEYKIYIGTGDDRSKSFEGCKLNRGVKMFLFSS